MPKQMKTDTSLPTPEQMEEISKDIQAERAESRERFAKQPETFGFNTVEPELNLGGRLQMVREAKALTQAKVAELTRRADKEGKGLSRAVVSFYEAGTTRPGPKEIRLLCEVLQVSPSYLIYGSEDPFNQRTDYDRFLNLGRTDAEHDAFILYLFSRLESPQKMAMLQLMRDLLNLSEKGFSKRMKAEAIPRFLEAAKQLEEELRARGELK